MGGGEVGGWGGEGGVRCFEDYSAELKEVENHKQTHTLSDS